mmetsp:Transcript_25852/g.76998  ORF Transcript_25852/g.76998 Transcript_25852/m.76998 type:complete len:257 (-) Transcript_25852:68-838(-)
MDAGADADVEMETDEESEEEGRSGEESELEGPRREHRDPVVDRQNMARSDPHGPFEVTALWELLKSPRYEVTVPLKGGGSCRVTAPRLALGRAARSSRRGPGQVYGCTRRRQRPYRPRRCAVLAVTARQRHPLPRHLPPRRGPHAEPRRAPAATSMHCAASRPPPRRRSQPAAGSSSAASQAGGGQTQPTQVLQSVASAAQRVLRDDDSDASRSDGEDEGEETGAASGASSEESEGGETASSGSASSEDDMLDPSE